MENPLKALEYIAKPAVAVVHGVSHEIQELKDDVAIFHAFIQAYPAFQKIVESVEDAKPAFAAIKAAIDKRLAE